MTEHMLRTALERAKENLALCHERHSGEYIGGMEYTSLMGLIDEALSAVPPQAGEAVSVPDGRQLVPKGAVRCLVTGNPFGTDTWRVGDACRCKVCQVMLSAVPPQGDSDVRNFAKAILHGDDVHRAWLIEAAEAFVAGQPLPKPRAVPPQGGEVRSEDVQTIACRLKGCCARRELPTWAEIEFAADALLTASPPPPAIGEEKIARTLFANQYHGPSTWETCSQSFRDYCLSDARAVLAFLNNPERGEEQG